MTAKKRYDDSESEVVPIRNGNGAVKSILIAVICAFIVGMGGYIFNRGINTNIAVAEVVKDVAVLKECVSTMKADITDIKELSKEIRYDQIRRQKAGK
jgi:ABC-type Na+ transport system ATPase subunit NatA